MFLFWRREIRNEKQKRKTPLAEKSPREGKRREARSAEGERGNAEFGKGTFNFQRFLFCKRRDKKASKGRGHTVIGSSSRVPISAMPTLSAAAANRDSLRRRGAASSSSSMKPRAPSSFCRRSSCAADEEEGRRARSPTTSTGGESVATCFKNEAKTWLGHSSAAPPTLLSVVTGVRSARRSHLQLDHRPLHITTFERFRRYAETTNIHGFLPLSRYKEIGWFFRVVYLFMLSCGISCAFYFIRLETINFWKDVVDITNDFEQ